MCCAAVDVSACGLWCVAHASNSCEAMCLYRAMLNDVAKRLSDHHPWRASVGTVVEILGHAVVGRKEPRNCAGLVMDFASELASAWWSQGLR